jgi:outer membrane immunogenic protein
MRTRLYQAVAFAAVLAAGATASSPAVSADLNGGPPPPLAYAAPPPPTNLFAGWWVGATVGGATAKYDFTATNSDIETSGILGGGTAGWNWQNGPIVIGLEGDVLAADVNGERHFNAGANKVSPDINTMADLRLRAGVAVNPQLLLFATAGGAWADANLPITGPGGASRDGTFFGWSVGGGAEVAFNPNWSARFDYQFTDFDSESVSYPGPGGKTKYDPDMNTYRGSLIYHF